MNATISCFIDGKGKLSLANEVGSKESEYYFDLVERRVVICSETHRGSVSLEQENYEEHQDFFDQFVSTPEKLMEFAKQDHLNKATLTALLNQEEGQEFLRACAIIEKETTERCGSLSPCLEDGCAFEGTDEVCLNAVLLSEGKCLKTCVDVWIRKFQNPENRIEIWRK